MKLRAVIRTDFSPMDRLNAVLPGRVQSTVFDVGEAVIADIQSHWYPTSPSPRGSAPAVVSGELSDSIHLEATGRTGSGKFTASENASMALIKIDAAHGGILESDYLDRPFLEPALDRIAPMFPTFFERLLRPS